MNTHKPGIAALTLGVIFLAACDQSIPEGETSSTFEPPVIVERSYTERIGTSFDGPAEAPITAVVATEVALSPDGGDSIWGALGVNAENNIWVGISGSGSEGGQLFSVTSPEQSAISRGSAVQQSNIGEVEQSNQHQKKIHSRIREADDGYVYFTTMNETNESWRDNRLPTYGGIMWRLKPGEQKWEHVMSTPEALIALETVGRYVYALGYWGHILYQYDTYSGKTERLNIGADCGHVSRNFLVDLREHAYVPRVLAKPGRTECTADDVSVRLVEVSPTMKIAAEHMLPNYLGGSSPHHSQGITAYAYRQDESIIFSNIAGELYHLIAHGRAPALILQLGKILPNEKTKLTNLVGIDGKSLLGAAVRLRGDKKGLHWVMYNTTSKDLTSLPIAMPPEIQQFKALLLYGSGIRDRLGHAYVGGRIQHQHGKIRPLLLRLSFAR